MLGSCTHAEFLERHWQRRPLLIRQGARGFACPITGDDLAGIACEELVESRLVSGTTATRFQLELGPFDESRFAELPRGDWTLLVQDVDKHLAGFEPLLAGTRFLPEWRVDDVMASFASPGGSVGPHVDQYDVFLVQAAGRRCWQWAEHFDPALRDDCELAVLASFEAEHEVVVEPGDVLYLPPGVAHFGRALEPCVTLSVGFRAPDQRQLALAFVEEVVDRAQPDRRFTDSGRAQVRSRAGLLASDREQLRSLLRQALATSDAQMDDFLGRFLSRPKENLDPMASGDEPTADELDRRLRAGHELVRRRGSRWVHYAVGDRLRLFVDGARYAAARRDAAWIERLARHQPIDASVVTQCVSRAPLLRQLLASEALCWAPTATSEPQDDGED